MGIKKRGAFVPPVQADTVLGHFACPDLKRLSVTWIHKKGTGKERLNQQK
jgi:antibiotic biosynthesis monooxygenase (ABM) superfamily enzyme